MDTRYFELVTDIHPDDLARIKVELGSGKTNPRDIKMSLVKEITVLYFGVDAAALAEEHFMMVFQRREMPENIAEYTYMGFN